jgi:hypothetical protein
MQSGTLPPIPANCWPCLGRLSSGLHFVGFHENVMNITTNIDILTVYTYANDQAPETELGDEFKII